MINHLKKFKVNLNHKKYSFLLDVNQLNLDLEKLAIHQIINHNLYHHKKADNIVVIIIHILIQIMIDLKSIIKK